MSHYTKAKGKPRSPLGREIAGFLSPKSDNATLAASVLGQERAAALLDKLVRIKLRNIGKGKLRLEKTAEHEPNAPHIGRFLAWCTMVLEQADPNSGRACTRQLYQGRAHRWDPNERKRVCVPAKQAGGVAARLGIGTREVQAYTRLAHLLGLLQRWQVKCREQVQALPRKMRGKRWSYAIYVWADGVPRAVVERLREWWGKPAAAPDARPAPRGGQDDAQAAQTERALAKMDGELRATLERLLGVLEPPPT